MHAHLIEQLTKQFNHRSIEHTIVQSRMNNDDWIAVNRPYTWQLVETNGCHSVYVDTAYGWLALFENGKLIGYGKDHIVTADCVVVCKDYYGSNKYIWK